MRALTRPLVALIPMLLAPTLAFAQASIAGAVRDTTGAVLPGVTVEAASPALIERTRSVVTDGTGQYHIVDLRPGVYTVTFSLAGFNTIKREGIELIGSFTATVNADLKVGTMEETVTVTGETPIVDVQTATQQRVIGHEVADAIPTGRSQFNLAVLIPGVSTTNGQDVGGSLGTETNQLTVHGSKGNSQRITQNGISLGTLIGDSSMAGAVPNMSALQELTIDTSAASAELPEGGVRVNIIPREGGNTFRGNLFGSWANSALQSNNFTSDLAARGLAYGGQLLKVTYDINPGLGGPIRRDQLWFYGSVRRNVADNYAPGIFFNQNAGNRNAWTYVADPSQGKPDTPGVWNDANVRLTYQLSPRNKLGASLDYQTRCTCPNQIGPVAGGIRAPEAGNWRNFPLQRSAQIDYTSPITSRVLLEVVGINRIERWGFMQLPYVDPIQMIPVNEQGGSIPNLTYRAQSTANNSINSNFYYRAAVSYVTGAHNFKVGFNDGMGYNQNTVLNAPIQYRFLNGVPNQITLQATPYTSHVDVDHILGLYAQDKWTARQVTLTLGVRYDHFSNSFPEQSAGPALLTPLRNITFPAQPNTDWNDVSPKSAIVYDLFGDGKTALRASLNRYLAGQGTSGLPGNPNPILNMVTTATRAWRDDNQDYVPNCDLVSPAANGECAAISNPLFGSTAPGAAYDPAILTGWQHRDYNWEFSAGVQHQILPRVSAEVAYFRRWYGNFTVTDNLAVAAADYDQFTLTGPVNASLPTTGSAITGALDLNPAKFGVRPNNYVTFASNYGTQIEHWNGLDVNVTTRMSRGIQMSAGLSTGRTSTDVCDVASQVPEMMFAYAPLGSANAGVWTPLQYCHIDSNFLTQVKGYGSYTVPRIDVQISAAFQSIPGPMILANYVATNAVVVPALGRVLSGGAQNTVVDIVPPGTVYGDRLNQLDLRFGKLLRFAGTRTLASIDLYNALNANPVQTYNNSFVGSGATWQTPLSILTARFLKFSVQFDF